MAFLPLVAMSQLSMGSWKTYFSYNLVSQVEQTPSKIFGVSDGALFSVEKADNSIQTYSKLNGLHDFSISKVKYHSQLGLLIVTYADGNIDLMSPDGTYNMPEIKNSSASVDKNANDILLVNNYAYISCGIGIVKINLKKREITDTYVIGANSTMIALKSTAIFGDSIYTISKDAIYSALASSPVLANYSYWHEKETFPETTQNNVLLLTFGNKLFLLKASGSVYSTLDGVNWTLFDNSQTYTGMKVSGDRLLLYGNNGIKSYNQNFETETYSGFVCSDVLFDNSTSAYWEALGSSGLVKMQNGTVLEQYKPDGPATNKIFTLKYQLGRLYALSGARWDIYDDQVAGALMIYDESTWRNFTKNEIYPLTGKNFIGITNIAVDKNDPTHYYVSSSREGLYEFRENVFYQRFNYSNSGISSCCGNNPDDYQDIDGLCLDHKNNLWMTNDVVSTTVVVMLNDGTWVKNQYAPISGKYCFDKIIETKNYFKWMNLPHLTSSPGGLFVLDDKSAPANVSSHQYRFFPTVEDQDGNNISVDPINCMAEDQDGVVWVGSDHGPLLFQNISYVFNTNYTVYRPKIPRNDGTDYADYLLDGQKILSITVDGGNRKWIGTDGSGVYLMSPDGLTTIRHFTTDNSPLLSDKVWSIAINSKTGEVFFATDMGLVSYKSDATEASSSYDKISVYPNPVRPDFTGVITITGLEKNTVAKITDANGNLVYQAKSNGGIVTWDGLDASGRKAPAGVYFVLCSSISEYDSEMVDTTVGKFMIIR